MIISRCRTSPGAIKVFIRSQNALPRSITRSSAADVENNPAALARLFQRSIANNNLKDAEYVIFHMNKHKMKPPKESIESLIYAFTSVHQPNKVSEYLQQFKQAGYKMDITMINKLIQIHLKQKDYKLASKTFYQALTLNIQPNLETFEILIPCYYEIKQYGSLLALTSIMYQYKIELNRTIYEILLQTYIYTHKPPEILRTIAEMHAKRMFPTEKMILDSIKFFVEFGFLDHVIQLTSLPELRLSSEAHCHLIHSYIKGDCITTAEETFHEMKSKKLQLNSEMCKWFLEYYIRNNQTKVAFRFFNTFPANFKQSPTLYVYVINTLLQNNHGKSVPAIFQNFEKQFSIPQTTNMYNALIGISLDSLDELKAEEYLTTMKEKNIPPNIETYNYFLRYFTKTKLAFSHWPKIEEILQKMKRKKLTPTGETFYFIVRYAILCNDHLKAEAYLKMLLLEYPDVAPYRVYDVMIEFYSTTSKSITQMLIEQLIEISNIKPNRDVFNSIIGGFTAFGDVENTIGYFDKMNMLQISPNAKSFTYLIKVCCKHSLINDATRYLSLMKNENGITARLENYNDLIFCCARVGDMRTALKYLTKLTSLKLTPNKQTYDHIIAGYYLVGDKKWAEKFASQLNILVDKQKSGAEYFKTTRI